jgi:hypothetical protein
MEAVRLARFAGTFDDHVELKRTNGSTTILRVVWRILPRNGGCALFLFCPYCEARAVTSTAGNGIRLPAARTWS